MASGLQLRKGLPEGEKTRHTKRSSAEHLDSLSQLYSNPTRNASMKAIERLMAAKRKEKRLKKHLLTQMKRNNSGGDGGAKTPKPNRALISRVNSTLPSSHQKHRKSSRNMEDTPNQSGQALNSSKVKLNGSKYGTFRDVRIPS